MNYQRYFDDIKNAMEVLESDIEYVDNKGVKITNKDKEELLIDIKELRYEINKLAIRIKNTIIIR